jgi:putative transposase
MAEVCADFGAQLREFNGETDHVHLLVHYPPPVGLSKVVNSLKGVSARHLRREFHDHLPRYLWDGHRSRNTSKPETTDVTGPYRRSSRP